MWFEHTCVCEQPCVPFPHTRMLPLESPVIVSPFSAKVTHNTNLGFSCFCKTRTINFARLPLLCTCVHFTGGFNTWDKSLVTYLKQALLPDQCAFLQVPEIQVRFATGHCDVAVCWVEVYSKHWLIGALGKKGENTNSFSLSRQNELKCLVLAQVSRMLVY